MGEKDYRIRRADSPRMLHASANPLTPLEARPRVPVMELSTFMRDAMAEVARGVRLANDAVRKEAKGGTQNYVAMHPPQAGTPGGWIQFDLAVQPGAEGVVEVLQAEAGRSVSPSTVSRMGFHLQLAFSLP